MTFENLNKLLSLTDRGWTVGLAVAGLVASLSWAAHASEAAEAERLREVEERTLLYIEYYDTIELNAAQEAIKEEALTAIPAPCCSDNTAYTCCCECNMAKSWWGLTHHLIVNEGADAEAVRAAVAEWIEFINPDGFSGKSCYSGGCARAFRHDGCGGMSSENLVL